MTPYEQWFETYDRAYDDPQSLAELACPNCGAKQLRMIFVLERAEAAVGNADEKEGETARAMVAFWCDACLHGLPPQFTLIPSGGERVVRGREQIPNYRLVTE